ncbi:hypothetical protein LBMAG49_31510 [Planctomycetota bacterium]|nr:ABC transporter permease subunit [Planctomycetota bacterium]MSR37898.1 hypothetical protein [Planctomycetota bacterium]GDY03822.1 hypothetical protein LBMAG49_31510 [Planctomycetota bacterium]
MGFFSATIEITRQTLRQLLQNRMCLVVGFALVAIALIGYLLGGHPPRELKGSHLYALMAWWLLGTVLLPWTTLYFGVQAVHGDIEDRSFQYLFLRPVSRAAILLGKWLAVALLCSVMFTVGAVLLFFAFAARPELWPLGVETEMAVAFAEAMAWAAFAYASIAVLFAAKFQRPLVFGAFFIVGLQMFIGNMPAQAGIRVLTITDPLRRLLLDGIDPDPRLARVLWPSEREFKPDLIGHPLLNLSIIIAVTLVLALWFYTRSEYDSRSRE